MAIGQEYVLQDRAIGGEISHRHLVFGATLAGAAVAGGGSSGRAGIAGGRGDPGGRIPAAVRGGTSCHG